MGLAFWRVYHEKAAQAVAEGREDELPQSPLQALQPVAEQPEAEHQPSANPSAEQVVKALAAERQEVADRVRQRTQASVKKQPSATE